MSRIIDQKYVDYFDEMLESGLFTNGEIVIAFSDDFDFSHRQAMRLFNTHRTLKTI